MNYQGQPRATQIHALFLALIGLTIVGAFALIWVHGFFPRTPSSIDIIVEAYKSLVKPEPTEQFTFAVLAVFVPTLALALSARRTEPCQSAKSNKAGTYLPVLIAGLSLWTIFGSDFVPTVTRSFEKNYSWVDTVALLVSVLAAALLCRSLVKHSRPSTSGRTRTAWLIFLAAVFLQMASWRVVSFASVVPTSAWQGHADPLFYVMAQVQAGKTLLSDLPSQYGLFPEMLGPVFRVVGLTVGRVSLLFALMQVASMVGLFFVLSKFVKSRVLLTVAGLALVQITFETVMFNAGYEERYFQYWPLRFFWPAISVVVFHWFSLRPNLVRAATFSILGAVALLWNLDSGFFIVVAFGAYLAARAVMSWAGRTDSAQLNIWTPRTYATALALHVAITAVIAASFVGALALKAGQPLHFRWLFEYQKVFTELGLAMMPLPRRPHPWMAILAVYLAGMLQAFFMWKRAGRTARKADMLFYLSMLGLGVFVYYAGRSHILNLVTVCWPAAMLVALFSDEILRALRAKIAPPTTMMIAVVGCGMLILAAGSFVARSPSFAKRTWIQFATRGQSSDPLASNELAFIQRHAPPNSQCVILSRRQGIYHAQARVASPFQGPGIVETVLVADQRRLLEEVFSGSYSCLFVGIGPQSAPNFAIDMYAVLKAYDNVDQSPNGTMLYLKPKSK